MQGDPPSPSQRRSALNIHWKDWCWGSSALATWCEELTHWKRPWCWESLRAGGEGDDRGWGGWMASPTRWTWVWAGSGRWWRAGRPGVLQSWGHSQTRLRDSTTTTYLVLSFSNDMSESQSVETLWLWDVTLFFTELCLLMSHMLFKWTYSLFPKHPPSCLQSHSFQYFIIPLLKIAVLYTLFSLECPASDVKTIGSQFSSHLTNNHSS